MKFKRNLLILSAILIGILIVVVGCLPAPTTPTVEEEDVPTNGTISIAAAAVNTNDTTPKLTLSSTGATYMAFSGNGTTWSSWVAYATTYSTFNITTGAGCTSVDGTKIVYVKFKNDVGESTKVYDSIILDTVAPKLSTAVYTDVDSSGTVNISDKIVFTFNDEMLTSTVAASTVSANLLLSDSKSYGTSPAVSWDSGLKICYVTLGTSPTLVVGTTTVNPSALVKDTAGNADASTAITISGATTTVLSSVTISPSTYSAIEGSSTTKTFTASALSTAATTMTSSCTFTWSISGTAGGTITSTTYTAVYTPPASGTGIDTIAVSAKKTGTTTPVKTATTIVTVTVATTPSTTADATKLFVSAQRDTAIYTDVPSGGYIDVYTFATDEVDSAEVAGKKFHITASNTETAISSGKTIGDTDFIYFKLYTGSLYSAITSDGQIPVAPNPAALANIQAIGTGTVTSSKGGNLLDADKIRCYVGTTAYSTYTTVGTDISISPSLAAGNEPLYTRTNAAGHESAVSNADGAILILNSIAKTNAGGTAGTLETGDTITLTYSGQVNVVLPIWVSHLTWTKTSGGTAVFGGALEDLKSADPIDSAGVVLTASAGCVNFVDSAETVTFNVPNNIRIVDATGGNFVLKCATDFTFDSSAF